MMNNNNNSFPTLSKIFWAYIIVSQLFALYFWFIWAKNPDNGIISTLLLGPLVAEIKGLMWIIFIW